VASLMLTTEALIAEAGGRSGEAGLEM